MSKVTIKMIAGSNYGSPLFGGRTLNVGDTIEVPEASAEAFTSDGYYDASNNFHPYFKQEDDEAPQTSGKGKKVAAADDDHSDDSDGSGNDGGSAQDTATKTTGKAGSARRRNA